MTGNDKARALLYAILLASAVTLIVPLPVPLRASFAFIQTYYLPGFVFLLFCGNRRDPRLDDLFLPLLISPVLVSTLVLGCNRITGSLPGAIRAALALFYLLLVISLFIRRSGSSVRRSPIPRVIVLISAAAGAVVIGAYLANRYLLVYTDAWHHASVTYEILDRGIPPLEPRFPDVAIRYMWIYHLFQAVFLERSGLDIYSVLAIFNVVTAFVFPYLVARLTALLTGNRRYILATPIFAFAGLQSASWILWPVFILQSLFGEVRGMEGIVHSLRGIEFNGAKVIYFLTPPFTWLMNMMDKFLTITAMSYALSLFLFSFIAVIAGFSSGRSRLGDALVLFVAMIGCFLFHVVIGLSLIIAAVGAGILLYLYERVKLRSSPPLFQWLGVPAVAAAAFAAALPYFVSLTGGAGSGTIIRDHLHFGYTNLFTTVAPLIVLLPFSLRAIRDIVRTDERPFRILMLWVACLFILGIFADLPGIAENKIVFPIFMLLVLPVSWRIVDGLAAAGRVRRALLSVWILVLFAVPPVLTVRGFVLERPDQPQFEKRYRLTEAERDVYRWIRENTGSDAVMIEENTYNLMPVYARRRNFILQPTFIHVHNYSGERVARYVRIHRNLFSEESISEESIEILQHMPHSFYVVLWREELEDNPHLRERFASHPEWFARSYENAAGIVYRVVK